MDAGPGDESPATFTTPRKRLRESPRRLTPGKSTSRPTPQKGAKKRSSIPRAVDVTDGKFRLDSKALAKILCQPSIEDKPVAVVGIAGNMKTGKSFALSFLMRYLRNQGWKNTSWIGDGETCANDGIEWKVSKHPNTKGICVWNEVFVVEKENGDELAVLLVDTQGLFDRTMTREDNIRLLTFTALFCSRLMLNIRDQINDRDLEYLQFFAQYAKTVMEEIKDDTPFQDLIFLIRDWQYPGDNPYGLEGGMAYLEDFLKIAGNNEADCIRRDLRSAFGKVQSFLMPHPGMKVNEANFRGRNSDLEKDFLTSMKDLVRVIFDRRTLKERLHNGKTMTGRHLWSLLNDCNRAFEDGAAPEVKNMVEVFSRMINKLACEDGVKKFREIFEQTVRTDRDALYLEAQAAALQYFEESTKFGPDKYRKEYKLRLSVDCQDQFKRICAWDEYRKLQAKNSSSEKLHEMWTNYKTAMKRDMEDRYKTDDAVGKLHAKHSEDVLLKYRTETVKEAAFHEEHLQLLKDFIGKSYGKLKEVNEERRKLESLGSQEDRILEYNANRLLHEISQSYRGELEKYSMVYIEEEKLKQQIGELQTSYLGVLSQNWDHRGPNVDNFRDTLSRLLEKECQDCLTQNARNKEVFEDNIEECLMEAKVQYGEEMRRITQNSYCDPSDFHEAHNSIVTKLMDNLPNASEEVFAKAQQYFSSKFTYFRELNEGNRVDRPHRDWDWVKNGIKVVTAVAIAIKHFTSLLKEVKSAYSDISVLSAEILPSKEALAASAPCTAGAAVVGVVAYCVYKHYKNPQAVQNC